MRLNPHKPHNPSHPGRTDSPELLQIFIDETEELLEALTFDVGRHSRPPSDLARRARRAVHTIKGNAAMLGLDGLVTASHEAEQRLTGESAGDRVLAALDSITPQINRLRDQLGHDSTRTPAAPIDTDRQMVRVNHQRLVELEQMVGEVSAATRRVCDAADGSSDPALTGAVGTLTDRVSALDDAVRRARMLPFGTLLGRAARLVRELTHSTGLPATLATSGEPVEVDRAVLDTLHPAVVQLIRNSFAHGFEPQAERRSAGKPNAGRISVGLSLDDATLEVRYADDGCGVDRDRLRERAVGLMPAETIEQLDDTGIDRLILEPGLTTSSDAGALSGRGVGMDVVRTQIERLGGRIEIDNAPGRGLTIRLIVPVSPTSG